MKAHRDPHGRRQPRLPLSLLVSMFLLLAPRAYGQTQNFDAGWDIWVARDATSVSCSGPYSFVDDCQDIVLARYNGLPAGQTAGRTYIALDFDTRPLPDNAIIDNVTLSLFVRDIAGGDLPDVPQPPLDCGDLDFFTTGASLNNIQVGIYWRDVPSVGYNATNPDDVVTEACNPAWIGIKVDVDDPDTADLNAWLTYALFPTIFFNMSPPVSATQVTRYGIDLELAAAGTLRALIFDSMRRPNGNKARLTVQYHLPGGGGCRPPCELDRASPASTASEGITDAAALRRTSWGRVKSIYR